jgi:hypothetical protein
MMANITVTPEVETVSHSSCGGVAYVIQIIDKDSELMTLIFNKENNILYEYIYDIEDRA